MAAETGKGGAGLSEIQSEIFQAFATYVALLMLKMMVLSYFVISERILKGQFVVREDYEGFGDPQMSKEEIRIKTASRDLYIERIRRCHRNDLENIIPFVLVAVVYILFTNPTTESAILHIRIFAAARIFHTVAYLLPLPQPCRFLAFLVGSLATISMAIRVIYEGKF
ncbi:microsomal glutathione S-transferase 1-like [Apostichopus japonicus]|uniref:microsomal glutathione S-transferase 1-like n=1 Tax=Stichopus japonicus TaxID=307972 RepID=UPI003AB8F20B